MAKWKCLIEGCGRTSESAGYMMIHLVSSHGLNKTLLGMGWDAKQEIISMYEGLETADGRVKVKTTVVAEGGQA